MAAGTSVLTGTCRRAAITSLIAVAISACSSGDSPQPPASTADSSPGARAPSAEIADFCSAAVDLIAVMNEGPQFAPGDPPEEVVAAFQEFRARLEPPLTAIEQNAPDAVRQEIPTLARQARYAVTTNDEAPLDTPEVDTSVDRIRSYMIGQCGFPRVDVTAVEFLYRGIPQTLQAGITTFSLADQGLEPHEIRIFLIEDGSPQPFKEILGLPEDQMDSVLTSEGELDADPGEVETRFFRLTPGRYGIACLHPKGSTAVLDGTGPPHFTLGEVAELVVR